MKSFLFKRILNERKMNSNVTNKNGKLMHAKRFSGILLNNLNKQRDDSTFCDVDFIIGPQKKK